MKATRVIVSVYCGLALAAAVLFFVGLLGFALKFAQLAWR
jgi:hypothetical protein